MSDRVRVALVFGGRSVEHEVSVVSARGVDVALDRDRYEVVPLGITPDGVWLPPGRSEEILRSGATRVECDAGPDPECVAAVPGGRGLLRLGRDGGRVPLPVDVVFSVVHGWGGEDGRMQGALDLAGVPCVGAGILGSAAAMDKAVAKVQVAAEGVPVGPWQLVSESRFSTAPRVVTRELADVLGFPVFAKPANGGSSVGIGKARDESELRRALEEAFRFDRRVLVEAALDAREIECAVLGNEDPRASVPGEIEPSSEFYDYRAKYVDGSSRLLIPAPIDPALADEVRQFAVAAFVALDLAGMARVDFFLERRTGALTFNEANSLPGFTPISMYPKLWEASGVPFPELLDRLIGLALERFRSERDRIHRFEP